MSKDEKLMGRTVSVVIPVYNEELILPVLWSRLKEVCEMEPRLAEVIFIDDGSTDKTPRIIRDICKKEEKVKYIKLSRNFGHQAALSAGIDLASGDGVVLMDGDLQDRPESIPDFIREWDAGSKVVYAIRVSRRENYVKQCIFSNFYRLLALLSGIKQPLDAGIFSMVDKSVLNIVRNMPEHNRYFPGLRAFAGFEQTGLNIERDERFAGKPRVGFGGLIKLAFDAIFSFSYVPIRLISGVGLIVASIAFCFLVVIGYKKFISHVAILGWSSTLGAVLFIGGLQLVMMGILGEYLARVYEETKRRPQYIIEETLNCDTRPC